MSEFGERPEALDLKGENWIHNEHRLEQAQEVASLAGNGKPPGDSPLEQETWRYYDSELNGHVYTRLERPNALEPEAVAALHGNDGSVRDVGRLRYTLDMEDCMLRGYTQPPETHGVESALQSEVSQRARAEGVHNMQVWVPDGESPKMWALHNFHEDPNDPGHWNRPL